MSAVGTSSFQGGRQSVLGALSALSVVLIWASWLVSTRHSVGAGLGPLDLSLLRYGIPALVLAPVWLRTGLFPKGAMGPLCLMVLGSGAPFFQIVAFGMRLGGRRLVARPDAAGRCRDRHGISGRATGQVAEGGNDCHSRWRLGPFDRQFG